LSLVLDVSVALAWILPDEEEPSASAAMAYVSRHGAVVSPIWWFELRNALLMAERRNRLTPTATAQSLDDIGRLPIEPDSELSEHAIFALARTHRLTVYDAAYLEIALRRHLSLATLDKALARAAIAEGAKIFA
jgi:predicted nucleic acid-binding protein